MTCPIVKSKSILQSFIRFKSGVKRFTSHKLIITEFGDPLKVVRQEQDSIVEPKGYEVLLKMLAAPVNPLDINIIQGKYPIKLTLPCVPGAEGVAQVIKVGPKVTGLSENDHVIPLATVGLWRTYLKLPEETLLKVPKELGLVEAATLSINPPTAYRILKDFVDLKVGDTVIQNGANSACGQNVIQLCKAWGINSVNIVRNRPSIEDVKEFLNDLGATFVLTEEELRKTDIFKTGKVAKPKLALDCIGGKSATEIIRNLQDGHIMITYGGMSREPITVPTSALIFKDVKVCGFRISNWMESSNKNEQWFEMFEDLISMMTREVLKGPVHTILDFENYKEALSNTLTSKGMIGMKYILKFEH